ncbi:hypothetical protein ONZ51_g12138 [Trametes cubensis]|uniref:Uncharacterized protein n=1 Tax=Trametes cubensis TaxID=1111947 RepID=A0AAD7X3P5_9APHY|nr:hypothetical protein ONZ51_g12138 [Trametes cubensis]
MSGEAYTATRDKFLQACTIEVDPNFVLDFSLEHIRNHLTALCPMALDLFRAFSTTSRQEREQSTTSKLRKENVRTVYRPGRDCIKQLVTSQALVALAARSQSNSYVRQVLGLYAYVSGVQRQVLTVLSHLGIMCSYPILTGTVKLPSGSELIPNEQEINDDNAEDDPGPSEVEVEPSGAATAAATSRTSPTSNCDAADENDEDERAIPGPVDQDKQEPREPGAARSKLKIGLKSAYGLLRLLWDASMRLARGRAHTRILGNVYDTINMMFKIAEQILGRKDSQQNGTCATALELHGASLDDMRTDNTIESFVKAPPLTFDDILLSPQESAELTRRLEHTILRIAVSFGGEQFARFCAEVNASLPVTKQRSIPCLQ